MSTITQVALEHTALLGETTEAIAADKAQIATPGSVLVLGPLPTEARRAAEAATSALTILNFDRDPPATGLIGEHQRSNAGCASRAASECLMAMGLSPERDKLASGFLSTEVPGRFERVLQGRPEVWVDAAHNLSGLQALASAASAHLRGRPIVLILGVSADRSVEAMVPAIAPIAERVIVTSARHRGAPTSRLAAACPGGATEVATAEAALDHARTLATELGGVVLATGGLFLAAEVAAAARGLDPASLVWL